MQAAVGLFSVGLEAYWRQFAGLRERLNQHNRTIEEWLRARGAEVVNLGLVDAPEKAFAAGHEARRADVDLLFLHAATYSVSASVLPVVRRAKAPVIVLNLAPGAAMDYRNFNRARDRGEMTGDWLGWCGACPVPEFANVFRRAGIRFFQVTGTLDGDDAAWTEIGEWLEAARVLRVMEQNRLGLMGHYYGGMLDIYTDLTKQLAIFGGHMETIEIDRLTALRSKVSGDEMRERCTLFERIFDVQADCSRAELERAARTSVALDRLVEENQLGSLAYFYGATPSSENEDTISSIILGTSYLTAQGVPVAGEYEVKNAQAMKVMDAFGSGGSFSEFYGIDFREDAVLFGHDGPGHMAIAEGRVKVKPLGVYHGKVGRGLSVEMSVKQGPVTLLSIAEEGDGLKLVVAEGESVDGPILEIGNTNSRYRFRIGARAFVEQWNAQGPAHHCAIGVGHMASKLEKLAALLGIRCARVA